MVEYSDIFDEVDEFQKKAKVSYGSLTTIVWRRNSENVHEKRHERIVKSVSSFEKRLGAVKTFCKSFWIIMKIITNLDRYLREPGANEDLLRPIIVSLMNLFVELTWWFWREITANLCKRFPACIAKECKNFLQLKFLAGQYGK